MSTAQSTVNLSSVVESDARDHVQSVVRKAGTSFFWAMRFLPRHKREAIFGVYAFCREVDDIADEPAPTEEKREGLDNWRREIARMFAGHPTYATTRALHPKIDEFDLKKADFDAVIDGMATDAEAPNQAPTMDELMLYCDRVACAVGRLCVHIFGEPGQHGLATAEHLGLALQLTNILRDIEEDAERGRIYLPAEILDQHGLPTADARKLCQCEGLADACRDLAVIAEKKFRNARSEIMQCDRTKMRPAIIMMEVYHRKLMRMRADGFADVGARPEPSGLSQFRDKIQKLMIALRYGLA